MLCPDAKVLKGEQSLSTCNWCRLKSYAWYRKEGCESQIQAMVLLINPDAWKEYEKAGINAVDKNLNDSNKGWKMYIAYKYTKMYTSIRVRLKLHLAPDSLHSQRKSFPSVLLKGTDIWWRATLDWAWALQMSLSSFITVTLVDMTEQHLLPMSGIC